LRRGETTWGSIHILAQPPKVSDYVSQPTGVFYKCNLREIGPSEIIDVTYIFSLEVQQIAFWKFLPHSSSSFGEVKIMWICKKPH
jgi:hypothetical protein